MCCRHLGNSYSKCEALIKQMTAISQVFMRYKISDSYCVFNRECHECIKNVQKTKRKKPHRKSTKASEKMNSFISVAYQKKTLAILKTLKLEIF